MTDFHLQPKSTYHLAPLLSSNTGEKADSMFATLPEVKRALDYRLIGARRIFDPASPVLPHIAINAALLGKAIHLHQAVDHLCTTHIF